MLKNIFGRDGAFRSWTFYGVVGGVLSSLVGHFEPGVLSAGQVAGLQVASLAVTALGLRRSQTKAVAELAELVQDLAAKTGPSR